MFKREENKPFYYIAIHEHVAVHNQLSSMNVIFIILISVLFCCWRCTIVKPVDTISTIIEIEVTKVNKTFNIHFHIQEAVHFVYGEGERGKKLAEATAFMAIEIEAKKWNESMKN